MLSGKCPRCLRSGSSRLSLIVRPIPSSLVCATVSLSSTTLHLLIVSTFAKARDVHRTLSRKFSAWAKPAGYKRVGSGTCAFARPRKDATGFLRFAVQISQWGADWSGNQFTINAEAQATDDKGPLYGGVRILKALSGEDLQIAEALQWHIIQSIPKPAPEHEIYEFMQLPGKDGEIFRDAFERAFRHEPTLFEPGKDIWLRYFSESDVEAWADYLEDRLLGVLDDLEAKTAT